MADHNANKIMVQVQVEPTPAVAGLTQADSPVLRAERAGTTSQQPTASEEARSNARRTQPDGATPDAAALGLPMPLTAVGSNEGLPRTTLAKLEQIELDDSILDLVPGEVADFEGVNLDFSAAHLEDDGEEIAQHIAETYNPEAEKIPPGQDYPELELGVDGLHLGESDSDSEEPPKQEDASAGMMNPTATPASKPPPPMT